MICSCISHILSTYFRRVVERPVQDFFNKSLGILPLFSKASWNRTRLAFRREVDSGRRRSSTVPQTNMEPASRPFEDSGPKRDPWSSPMLVWHDVVEAGSSLLEFPQKSPKTAYDGEIFHELLYKAPGLVVVWCYEVTQDVKHQQYDLNQRASTAPLFRGL